MAEVGDIYPGTNERVVGKIPAPGGGFWLQGERGGVFSEGGAPFLGSYFDPGMEAHRNDPNRRFTGIEATPGGGYRSISATPGEQGYAFAPAPTAPPAAPAPTVTTPPPGPTLAQTSAIAEINTFLTRLGLPASLGQWAWEQIQQGAPQAKVMLDLQERPEFQARFPAIKTLRDRQAGGEAVYVPTPTEYLQLETSISSVLKGAGLPPGFYDDPTDYAEFIGGANSVKEVEDRIAVARQMAFETPVVVREELSRIYDMSVGELVASFLDPDKALPLVYQRFQAGQIAGAAKQTGFGLLTRQEAESLAGGGLTEAAAGERFGAAAKLTPLLSETAEEAEDLGRAEALGFVAGNEADAERIRRRQAARVARFGGGGGASGIGGAQSGLGTAG